MPGNLQKVSAPAQHIVQHIISVKPQCAVLTVWCQLVSFTFTFGQRQASLFGKLS